jgi:transposase
MMQENSSAETQAMTEFPQIAIPQRETRKTISSGVQIIKGWQEKRPLIRELCRLNTRLLVIYTRALNLYIRHCVEQRTISDAFHHITDHNWHYMAMTELLYTIVAPNRKKKKQSTPKHQSVQLFIEFYLQEFPQSKTKAFFSSREPSKKVKSALRQVLKYTAASYSANCQVHLTHTFVSYLRRLVRVHMGKDKKVESAFVKEFIEEEEEEEGDAEENDGDNEEDNNQQKDQQLQEKIQYMKQQLNSIVAEEHRYALDAWPRTHTQMKQQPSHTLIIFYYINYHLQTQEAKRFNLLPTTSFRTNHTTLDKASMNVLNDKPLNDKTQLEDFLDLTRIRFQDNAHGNETQYKPITITTDSASVNVTLTKKSMHERREAAKAKARKEGASSKETSKKRKRRSKDKTKWQRHREEVYQTLKRKRKEEGESKSKSNNKSRKKQKTKHDQAGASGSDSSSDSSGGTCDSRINTDYTYRNHEERVAEMARRDGFIVTVPPRPHTPASQDNTSPPWCGFTQLAYIEHNQEQHIEDIAIAGLDPGIKNIAAISYGVSSKPLTLSQREYYHKINRNKNHILTTRLKRRHGIEQLEATIQPAVVATSYEYRQHIDSILEVAQELEAFYSRQRVLRCKFDQKKHKDSLLQRMASHVYEALAHGESQDSNAANAQNPKQRHKIRQRQRHNHAYASTRNQEASHNAMSTDQGNPPQQQHGRQGKNKSRKRKQKRKKKRKVRRKRPKDKKQGSLRWSDIPEECRANIHTNTTAKEAPHEQDTHPHHKTHTANVAKRASGKYPSHTEGQAQITTRTRFPILFYGNATFKHVYRGNRSVPNKRLLLELTRRMLVVGTDEYYTSQVCHACLQRSILKNSHDVVHCKNPQCHVTHSRDINSAKNIYLIGKSYLLTRRRHPAFCPPKDNTGNENAQ